MTSLQSRPMPADARDPAAILDDLWQRLTSAPADAHHPFRTIALCSLHNGEPDARNVVLRQVDRDRRELFIHTDRRSEKCRQLIQDNRSACLFYDAAEKLQLRARTIATVHTNDAIADAHWQRLAEKNRRVYATPLAPGEALDAMHAHVPDSSSTGRENFTVIRCVISSIDWLYLHPDGHRRICFHWQDGRLSNEWLAP